MTLITRETNQPNHTGINLGQALFGAIWGVWFGGITRDILELPQPELNIGGNLIIPMAAVKVLYILSSFTFIAFYIYHYDRLQRCIRQFPTYFKDGFSFPKYQIKKKEINNRVVVAFALIWGFILVTFFLFYPLLNNFFLFLFGLVQPLVWYVLDKIMIEEQAQ
jgi:hypothetical protein